MQDETKPEFFLVLAAKGKDEWNKWRRDPANKDVRVTFARIDFSQAPRDGIDFSGFQFGDFANFSQCKWRGAGRASFTKASFGDKASFTGAALGDGATFTGAAFGDKASFIGAAFGAKARFLDATFGDKARFLDAAFGAEASFTKASFDAEASFTKASFGDKATFTGATFGDEASFSRAAFGRFANFRGAAFGNTADFSEATFGEQVSFVRAAFRDGAIFDGATFGNGVSFTDATFGDKASFTGVAFRTGAFASAAFGNAAYFSGAAFGERASFASATFGGVADFSGAAFGDLASFENTVFKGRVEFTGTAKEQLSKDIEATADETDRDDRIALSSGPDHFLVISFVRARFNRRVDFSGRTFENETDFNYARFCYPPVFERATNFARIYFTGAYIGIGHPLSFRLTCDTEVLLRLGALRKNAGEKRDDDRERDLYIEERKAELGINLVLLFKCLFKGSMFERLVSAVGLIFHPLWILVMFLCWMLADYGRSFLRPAGWLALSVWLFHLGYAAILAPLTPKVCPLGDKYEHAVWMVALGNAVPFASPLTSDAEVKKLLFCAGNANCLPVPPDWFQLLVSCQNLFSIILVFFIVLALRNYFRIK